MLEVRADGQWLSLVGEVSGIEFSTRWGQGPSGHESLSFRFDYPRRHTPPMLRRGVRVELHDGSGIPVWAGKAAEPAGDGDGWSCHARGYGHEAERFIVFGTNPATQVNAAVSRGLEWVVGSTPATPSAPSSIERGDSLSALLDYAATQAGQRWVVWDQTLTVGTDPTTPSWVAAPEVPTPGQADDNFVSALHGRYVSAVSGTPPVPTAWSTVTVEDAEAVAKYGRVEALVDYTPLGLMTSGDVTADLNKRLQLAGGRLGFTEAVAVNRDTLATFGGVQAAPWRVRAGEMVRLSNLVDRASGASTDVVIQRTTYRADDESVTVEPLGLAARDLASVLAAPRPVETEALIDG